MLSRKLFRLMHKIALYAIVFASLAPSVSHALASQQQDFMQVICGVGGQKIYIQVVTTQGQQIQAGLDAELGSQPVSISLHMQHCPFCQAGVADVVMPNRNPAFALFLAHQETQQTFNYLAPFISIVVHLTPLTHGPPVISL